MAKNQASVDRSALRQLLDTFARDGERFPGGPHATGICTECAYLVVEQFSGVVRGYFHAHNETAAVGEIEGGHDFALTDERFLVDPWIFHYYCESPVLDLKNQSEYAEAVRRYGNKRPQHGQGRTNAVNLTLLWRIRAIAQFGNTLIENIRNRIDVPPSFRASSPSCSRHAMICAGVTARNSSGR